MTTIPEQEVLRYLRAQQPADESLWAQIREICSIFEKHVSPKHLYREVSLSVTEASLSFEGFTFEKGSFYEHLRHCSSVLLFAATLGIDADRITRAESTRSMLRGSIAHAAGAAMIEQYCDDLQQELAVSYEKEGEFLCSRYSPGYGDLPLSFQKSLFQLLPLEKYLGLSLNEHCMMIPSKSITAIIGISSEQTADFRQCSGNCLCCKNYACSYRKDG